jgi:hypothetical protein
MRKNWSGILWDSFVILGLSFKRMCLRLCGRAA